MSRTYFFDYLCNYIPTHGTHIYSLLCILYIYIYRSEIHNDLRNTAYWIVKNKTLNETAKGWTLYIFYWIKVFLKLPFAVSFSVLFYIYIYIHTLCMYLILCIYIYIYVRRVRSTGYE